MKTNQLIRAALLATGLAASIPAMSANLPISWDLTGNDANFLTTLSVTASGHTIKATAYSSANNGGSGALSSAYMKRYSGGIGVSDCITVSSSCNETGTPNHSIDTEGKSDFLLLEFDDVYQAKSFQVGWTGSDSDVQMWSGPAVDPANLNLTGACLTGCSKTLASLGFTSTQTFNNTAIGATNPITGLTKSRYVLVSGALAADANPDYFKLSNFVGSRVPEPGSLAIFGLGLLGLLGASRRKSSR